MSSDCHMETRTSSNSRKSTMLRILLLAPASNPDGITGPLIGYAHGEALARLHEVTFVIRHQDEAVVRRKQSPFHAIEVISPSSLIST